MAVDLAESDVLTSDNPWLVLGFELRFDSPVRVSAESVVGHIGFISVAEEERLSRPVCAGGVIELAEPLAGKVVLPAEKFRAWAVRRYVLSPREPAEKAVREEVGVVKWSQLKW